MSYFTSMNCVVYGSTPKTLRTLTRKAKIAKPRAISGEPDIAMKTTCNRKYLMLGVMVRCYTSNAPRRCDNTDMALTKSPTKEANMAESQPNTRPPEAQPSPTTQTSNSDLRSSKSSVPSPSKRAPSMRRKTMQTREQKGDVWKKGDWWWIRYADWIVEDGSMTRKQDLARKLAPVLPEHKRLTRPPEDVREEQKRFMARINGSRNAPERNLDVKSFAENVWIHQIEQQLTPSTVRSYRFYWERILSPRCGRRVLRDFSTSAAQALLAEIAHQNPEMKKSTLRRLKAVLSTIFKLAIQQDYRLGPNPIRETSLPREPEAEETIAHDLDTVLAMLRLVSEPSRTAIAIAAFAGLRRGEIEGLLWENFDGQSLKVARSIW